MLNSSPVCKKAGRAWTGNLKRDGSQGGVGECGDLWEEREIKVKKQKVKRVML